MRIRQRPVAGPLAYRVPRRRHGGCDPHGAARGNARTVVVGALAVAAAIACALFAPVAHAAQAMPDAPAAGPGRGAVAVAGAMSSGSDTPAAAIGPTAAEAPHYALVIQDSTPLRSGPKSGGAPLAVLGQGELLELRGDRLDYVQVWDADRERGGFVRASAVRPLTLAADEAPELLALVRFLRDRPGSEALGFGLVAAYLKAAPAGAITAESFDALGTMAERLAWRANAAGASAADVPTARPGAPDIAARLAVATRLGVHFDSVARDDGVALCYDGEAFRHALALSPTPAQAARAALALTRHDCIAPDLSPLRRWQLDTARAALLDRVPLAALAPYERNRIRMRQAGVWAALAFEDGRRLVVETGAVVAGLPAVTAADVRRAGDAALAALAGVDKAELADDDQSTYADAAMRVGASRWAAEPEPVLAVGSATSTTLGIVTRPGAPGETCVLLVDARHPAANPLARRCTYGTVWAASAAPSRDARALALAVQPLAAWRELWVFRATSAGWTVQVLPPAADAADANGAAGVGYVEFAGWVPGTGELLAARELRDPARGGRPVRRYELLDGATLATEREADAPGALTAFYRWQDPAWKRVTVSLR